MAVFNRIMSILAYRFTDADGNVYNAVEPYGTFHLSWFTFSVIVGILMIIFLRDVKAKTMKRIVFFTGLALVLGEIYKQLIISWTGNGFEYRWYAFPMQFCATPMYIMFIAGLLPDCKLRNGMLSYLSTYSFIAGISVMIFVGDVFSTPLLGECIQTMTHHGAMVAVGMWLMAWNRKRNEIGDWGMSVLVFLFFETVAMILNVALAPNVDLYFLSPYPSGVYVPVFGIIRDSAPYFIYLLIYNVGFTLGSLCFYELQKLIVKAKSEKTTHTV